MYQQYIQSSNDCTIHMNIIYIHHDQIIKHIRHNQNSKLNQKHLNRCLQVVNDLKRLINARLTLSVLFRRSFPVRKHISFAKIGHWTQISPNLNSVYRNRIVYNPHIKNKHKSYIYQYIYRLYIHHMIISIIINIQFIHIYQNQRIIHDNHQTCSYIYQNCNI